MFLRRFFKEINGVAIADKCIVIMLTIVCLYIV
nr:MAG TPA: hypothetical protein [Caudoviricetes sp.]